MTSSRRQYDGFVEVGLVTLVDPDQVDLLVNTLVENTGLGTMKIVVD